MPIKLELSKTAQKIFNNLKISTLDSLELKRLKYLNQFNNRRKLIWRLSLPLLLITVAIDIYYNGLQPRIGIYAAVPLLFSIFVKFAKRNYKRKYIKFYNNLFVPSFLKELLDYEYVNKKDMLESKLEGFRLLGDYHTYFGEDYLHGTVNKNINLEFEEVEVIGDLNNFKGGVILLEMPTKFKGRAVIKSKAVFRDSSTLEENLELIESTDKNFNKYFEVLTNNEKQAKLILTNKLMKKIIDTSTKLHDLFNEEFLDIAPHYHHEIEAYKKTTENKMATAAVELEFRDNKVLILLRGQYNLLAPATLDKSVYGEKRLSVIEQEFKAIESIVKLIAKGE